MLSGCTANAGYIGTTIVAETAAPGYYAAYGEHNKAIMGTSSTTALNTVTFALLRCLRPRLRPPSNITVMPAYAPTTSFV